MQCNPTTSKCLPRRFQPDGFSSFKEIVQHYIELRRSDVNDEFNWIRSIKSEVELIRVASYVIRSNGKRSSHHYRKPHELLERVRKTLLASRSKLARFRTFDQIYNFLESSIGDFFGVSELYIYDVSLILSVHRGITPERIYLHTGTREGARILRLPFGNKYLELSDIPKVFRTLAPHEIEDVFCIYKDVFPKILGA
jgi:hypothetical protein